MKKLLLLITIVLLGGIYAAQAQPLNRSTPEANLKSAKEAKAAGNLYAALEKYEDVYDDTKEKTVAAEIAMLNYQLRDYERAERGFSRLVLRDRKAEFTELKYWYAMSLKMQGKYPEAIDMYKQYLSDGAVDSLKVISKLEIEGCEVGRKAKQPENLKVDNLGRKVNSPQTESSPVYSAGALYYTSLNAKEVITVDGKEGDWYSKIYTAAPGTEGYGDPTALGTQINREGWHQGNVSISADGTTMFFTRVQLEANVITESKIYFSMKGPDGWGAAAEVVGVNGSYIAKHPCEGELFGEKVLFFVADIPGGKGGYDIYYSPKKKDGVYGIPVNLGDVINTSGEEASPFYDDGNLYFSSNGRPTMGGLDVFQTQWNGSVWSAPVNLGAGINSAQDDQFYTRANDGMSGFLVSNRPGPNNLKSKTCCDDMYGWEIERVKVELLAKTFRLRRKGEKENPPLTGCTVTVLDVTDPNPANVDQKTSQAADFPFTLLPDKSYMVIANNTGYQPDTVTFNTVGVKKSVQIEKRLTLRLERKAPEVRIVKKDEPIRLNSIYYDFNDDKILPDAEKDLQFLVDLMNKYPDMKIELSSHTDSRGIDEYNVKLSQRRANSAKEWLVTHGIAESRIVPVGYGEKQILNRCVNGVECTDDEHRFNRRTEFKILEGPTSITIEYEEEVPKN
ncbi:MAG: OmpA family protein [Lewinellaceae bacterium]|nr:OmpA family protein [Lewinellaceae bacterium]